MDELRLIAAGCRLMCVSNDEPSYLNEDVRYFTADVTTNPSVFFLLTRDSAFVKAAALSVKRVGGGRAGRRPPAVDLELGRWKWAEHSEMH